MKIIFEGLTDRELLARVGFQQSDLERIGGLVSKWLTGSYDGDCGKCGNCGRCVDCGRCSCASDEGDVSRPPEIGSGQRGG
jgi:hypothetical protein